MTRPSTLLALLSTIGLPLIAQANDFSAEIRGRVQEYLAAQTSHDFATLIATYHPESTVLRFISEEKKMRDSLELNTSVLRPPEFQFTLKECTILGFDDDYLIARVKEEKELTKQLESPLPQFPYRRTISDVLYVFRRHEDTWLIWTTKGLSSENELTEDAEHEP